MTPVSTASCRVHPDAGHAGAQVNKSTSQVDVQVLNLKLDELELASLRGDLQEAALHVNFDTRMGRGAVNVTGPRYSGLQACLQCDARQPSTLVLHPGNGHASLDPAIHAAVPT